MSVMINPILSGNVSVCEDEVPVISNTAVNKVTDDDSLYLKGNITYICAPTMAIPTSGEVNQTLTCTHDTTANTFSYQPEYVTCSGESRTSHYVQYFTSYAWLAWWADALTHAVVCRLMHCRFDPYQGRATFCCLYVAVYGS